MCSQISRWSDGLRLPHQNAWQRRKIRLVLRSLAGCFLLFPRDPRRRVARRKRLQRRFFDHVEFLVRTLLDRRGFFLLTLWFVHLLIPTLRSRTLPNASPPMISPWPSVHLCVLCVEVWNFITERTETKRGKFYWCIFSRSAFPSAMIFSISSGERGRRAVSIL
jgi:hypothetical protein